jgi:diguanylate cyclase (GGDEF)-like protein
MFLLNSISSIFRVPHIHNTLARWSRHLVPSLVTAAVGIALSVTAASMVALQEDRYSKAAFNSVAENYSMVLQNGVNEYLTKLLALRSLFDSSNDRVTRAEFEAFARPVLQSSSAIQTLSWVPRVLRSQRAEHELMAAQEGLPKYKIKVFAPDGSAAPAPEADEYFPIFYATVPKSSRLYGLDLRSEPPTLTELEHARDGDQLGFSQVPALVSAGGTQHGFIFSLPVYRQGSPHDTVENRRRNLVGFVHGSFVTARMIEAIISASTTPKGVDLLFYAPDAKPEALPLYVHSSRLRTRPLEPVPLASLMANPHWSGDLMAGSDRWMRLVAVALPGGPLIGRHERAWIVLTFGLIISGGVSAYVGASGRHASRLMLANQKVFELAHLDALTALANRRAFVERLNLAFVACQRGAVPFAVLYFDLDQFKDVNDTLGHPTGDALLRQVADRVKTAVREGDFVARFGGDEFAVLQSDVVELDAASTLAVKIGQILAAPYLIDGSEVHITASIGISRYTSDIAGPNAMMIQADLALYRAKAEGRNCFRFHSDDLDHQVQERVAMTDELRGALSRNELELHYQPQVELVSGRIVGLEGLLRWNNPKRGSVPPSIFIPIAERTGIISLLGQWVFDAACRQLRMWQDEGVAPERVSVNCSAVQFKGSCDLEHEVAASLGKWGIAPDMIEIELTESVLMEVTQEHDKRFERLRKLGITIAIDDFGTGYSSLNYLTTYPVQRLKIAQQLVSGVDTDSRSATVVRAAIRLAQELGIEIIAEGVETEAQAKFLVSAGCKHGQGFYCSRPVNAERATELLRLGKTKALRNVLRIVETPAA